MGVYIKNMEMPNKKNGAVLIIYPDGKCAFEDGKTYQAVPVPPHGRLIDADAMRAQMPPCYTMEEIVKAFKNAPTIIPASEESAKTEEESEPWLCLSCRYYPPSSTDGKPCSQCNPSEVWHSCYDPAEEGE